VGYKITDTRETQTITPAGTQKTVYRVWLITGRGATGAIDVEPDNWNTDDLPGILEAKAKSLDLAFSIAS